MNTRDRKHLKIALAEIIDQLMDLEVWAAERKK